MELYGIYFAALVCFNIALAAHRHQTDKHAPLQETLALPSSDSKGAASKFKREYFGLYALVMAADWLQGPYMYTLYKHEKGVPESTVASLFTVGFVTAGITASFVGSLADQYGRRNGCLAFCVTYGLSCLSVLSDDIFVLFVGRALGGLSTTLLYSVFEAWMIAEYHKRELSGCLSLGSMFSTSVTLSSIVAILSGVIGEAVVGYTGTKTSPFMAAFACLAAAFVGIQRFWSENYGDEATKKQQTEGGIGTLLSDRRILALTTTTTFFEGSMYLFVFFWSPTLISAHSMANAETPLPFGLIFSCFMCAIMLGSMIFSTVKPENARDAGHLTLSILALASWGLLIPVLQRSEGATFWSFALFEMCVGLYFPSMSRLKSEVVEDAVRAKVYGFMRLPLNVFIAVALGVTQDGDEHRRRVFTTAGSLLLVAFGVVRRYL
ncbi:uncharacterized protein LTR77_006761 [Saxophila tyrrhenica]|uniref:Molybdate-anion transporter n=1 Tax=Saxophila tyrrhenica TaxID=1690608 RepID=A0AAV9P7S1_9PEZI|nr:hypothetical protein LTR77_006761 [Saxophila tyrrhenica]